MAEQRQRPDVARLVAVLNGPDQRRAIAAARRLGRAPGPPPVLVSACLLGAPTRYDGGAKRTAAVDAATRAASVVPLCPELLGGLGCPRAAVHFEGRGDGEAVLEGRGAVEDDAGRDRTAALVAGARRALALAQAAGCEQAILKERSPSCGCRQVHAASGVVSGRGVFAALAARAGIACRSEEDVAIAGLPPSPPASGSGDRG